MNKVFFMLIAVLAAAGGAGAMFFMLQNSKASASTVKPEKKPTVCLPLEERTVNLADTSASHYAKVTLSLEIEGLEKSEKVAEELTPKLMDVMIDTVSQHTYSDLLAPRGKKALKKELMEEFNGKLEDLNCEVKEILFTDFVME